MRRGGRDVPVGVRRRGWQHRASRYGATAGVYVGGGIAPKILPLLRNGTFMQAFRAKEPMADFVATIPVAVILNDDAGLLGAAVYAQETLLGL